MTTQDPAPWAVRVRGWAREWGLTLLIGVVLFHVVGQLRAPDLPDTAPDFTAELLDGGTISLSDLHGQPAILNFWAPWCGPCRVEVPELRKYADAHPSVHVLGLATDGSPGELKATREKLGMTYPVARASSETTAAYGVSILPTTVVLDADGRVAATHAGILTRPQLAWMVP